MEIKGLEPYQFEQIVRDVSNIHYDGNVIVGWGQWGPTMLGGTGKRFRGRVIVQSSRGKGARRSWSGRRMPAACWHVFRDVVRATLAAYPGATFRTAMAYYTAANFEATYPATGYTNIGSMMAPVTMPELCDCDRVTVIQSQPTRRRPRNPLITRIDAVRSMEPGKCGWCLRPTMGDVSMWCSQSCQERWQERYAITGIPVA